jgi:hypothetical protein
MPYRCNNCDVLSATDDVATCKNRALCDMHKVEVIHFQTPNGCGRTIGENRLHGKDGQDIDLSTTATTVKLGCDTTFPNPVSTTYYAAVTCLNCLKNHPVAKPESNTETL